ncbi:MAG: hypothetical protein WBA16_06870, partial [Nonlabens sp.]
MSQSISIDCQNTSVQLDSNGQYTLTTAEINNASTSANGCDPLDLSSQSLSGPSGTLTTFYNNNNDQRGVMFDVDYHLDTIVNKKSLSRTSLKDEKGDNIVVETQTVFCYPLNPFVAPTQNDQLNFVESTAMMPLPLPYFEDFESGTGGWVASGRNSSWQLGYPLAPGITRTTSGINAWVTNLTGSYDRNESSMVVGPALDFSSAITDPVVRLEVWWESEFSWDGAALQSSIDGGTTWQLVGDLNTGQNWYTDDTINAAPGGQQKGWTADPFNNGLTSYVTAANTLTGLAGQSSVKIRVAFASTISVSYDGFAFDDVAVFEPTAID